MANPTIPVIDFHTHPHLLEAQPIGVGPADFVLSISPAVREHGARLRDPGYVAALLRAEGVRRAVVLPEHCPATSGNVRTETVIELCRTVPDLFLPFASVDPNTAPDPAGLLRRYIDEGPVHGLKLYPSYQYFYPNERRLYPIYEVCVEHRLPLLLHIGTSVLPGTRLKYCDPIHLDDVAIDFPELAIVMAHGGRGWWYDACATLATLHENVYIDVTGLVPSKLLDHFPALERMADKVIFGSDWPAMPKSVAHNARAITALGLSPEATRKILHDNAARLLGLSGEGSGTDR